MSEKEFATAMKTLGIAYNTEITADILKVYYEILKTESYSTIKKAISETIKKKSFFPTVSDLLEECKKQRTENGFAILEFMKSQGYFHESEYSISEYDKANNLFVKDVNLYNENINIYNQYQVTNQTGLSINNYETYKEYIDYNKDGKFEGKTDSEK